MIDVDAAAPQRVFKANTILVRSPAVRVNRVGARKSRRTEQAAAKSRAFLVCPIDQPNRDRRAAVILVRKSPKDLQGGHHTQTAIQPSAIRNRVEMASQDQRLFRVSGQGDPAIPCGIIVILDGQAGKLRPEPLASLEPSVAPSDPLRTVLVSGESPEFLKLCHRSLSVDAHVHRPPHLFMTVFAREQTLPPRSRRRVASR